MQRFAASVAVFDAGRILLILREDVDVWAMPGGHLDPGESIAACALREVREETGLEVELDRLVGVYSRPLLGDDGFHVCVFGGHPVGGTLDPHPDEVIELGWFDPADLPEPLVLGARLRTSVPNRRYSEFVRLTLPNGRGPCSANLVAQGHKVVEQRLRHGTTTFAHRLGARSGPGAAPVGQAKAGAYSI